MAEYNINNLSQDKILDLISSKFTIKEIEDLNGTSLCVANVSRYFYEEVDCENKDADFCNTCLFGRKSRPKLLDLLKDREQLKAEEVDTTKIALKVIRPINSTVNATIHVDWPIGHETWVNSSYPKIIGKMNEFVHPEENKYRMNVPATYFAPLRYSDFEGPFKVGDWVEITKSDNNWASSMDDFIGKKVQITEVCNNGWSIKFKGDESFCWNYYEGHFIPCSPPKHLIRYSNAGEPKENRKYSIKEIEANPRLLVYLDSEIDYIKITARIKNNYLAYHPEKCHNFNKQLYCSESGLNKVGSFPENSIILVYEDIDLNEEKEEKREGIVTRPYSRGSSISNIIKLIKV